jgi:hypothetical protein
MYVHALTTTGVNATVRLGLSSRVPKVGCSCRCPKY